MRLTSRFRPIRMACALCFVLALSACSSSDPAKEADQPVEVLYNKAADAMKEKSWHEATRLFEEVERQHPYSKWATKAQLMSAFSSYQDQRYDEAIMALDRFIELHPGNDEIDYAYYLKALSYYEQITDVRRDQQITDLALGALETLINRFPDSKYVRDATLKRDLTLDHLAGKEMEIGRYYLKQGMTNAAINRFRAVVEKYQTTTHVPEALHRLVECYMTLGLKDEAMRVAAVLGYNYPGSSWYADSYDLLDPAQRQRLEDKRSWTDRTVRSLFRKE